MPALNTVSSTKTAQVGATLEILFSMVYHIPHQTAGKILSPLSVWYLILFLNYIFVGKKMRLCFKMSMPVLVNPGCGSINAS